jgi:hypothetical protein
MLAFQRCAKKVFQAVGLVTRHMLGRGSGDRSPCSNSVVLVSRGGAEAEASWACEVVRPIFDEVVRNTGFELRISFSFSIWWGAVLDCGSCLKGIVGTSVFLVFWMAISGSCPISQNPFADFTIFHPLN